jgi:hypothetical protein
VQDFLSPRQEAEEFKRRPGYMEKKTYFQAGYPFSKKLRKQHELIIVYPDTVTGAGYLCYLIAENLIHLLISLPEAGFVDRAPWEIVKERPDGLIAKSLIVVLHLPSG